jgi:hypothetical protein
MVSLQQRIDVRAILSENVDSWRSLEAGGSRLDGGSWSSSATF